MTACQLFVSIISLTCVSSFEFRQANYFAMQLVCASARTMPSDVWRMGQSSFKDNKGLTIEKGTNNES
jgi:hypothetical protein